MRRRSVSMPGHGVDRQPRRTREAGSMAAAVVVGGVALALAVLIGSLTMSHVMATRQARSTADLAALAGAGQAVQATSDGQACGSADDIAEENGAHVVDCEVVRAGEEVAVRVEVRVPVPWTMPGLPGDVSAVAYAGNPR